METNESQDSIIGNNAHVTGTGRFREITIVRPVNNSTNNSISQPRALDNNCKSEMGTQASFDDDKTPSDEQDDVKMDFTRPFLFSDIVIYCGGVKLHCHRVILALYSPVFKRMFECDFKEKESNTVTLPEDECEDMVELLRHMYSPVSRDMDSQMAIRLLPLLHKYLINTLMEMAERMISYSMTDSSAPECLLLAERYGLSKLRQSALEACAKWDLAKLNSLMTDTILSADLKAEIYERRIGILEKCISDIQRSFTHSCVRMESKLERVPANHCSQHQRPLTAIQMIASPPAAASDAATGAATNPDEEAARDASARYNVSASIRPAAGMLGQIEERPVTNGSASVDAGHAAQAQAANQPGDLPLPGLQTEQNPAAVCEKCVENFKDHISELCKRAMHKVPIVFYKANR